MIHSPRLAAILRCLDNIPVRIAPAVASHAHSPPLEAADWATLALMILLAGLARVIFFTGLVGSDDVIYTEMAVATLHGDWTTWDYVGALRYGVNLPVAGLMAVFGSSEFNANLWSLLCSLGEVATVFIVAHRIWGRAAAVLSALVLGLLPLHVASAGRLLADSPLTFFVTLCFAFFYFAERDQRRALFLAAGLALGAVYWVKESVAALIVPTFLLYALVTRTFRRDWLWAVAGAAFMLLANMGLMWLLSGDPWLIFHVANTTMGKYADRVEVRDSPMYYFRYMFLDSRHTWLMPFLAVAGACIWWRTKPKPDGDTGYVVLWALGLLSILSFTIVSLSPLHFIPKQTNYMLIFAAPLSLLAGYWLASRLRKRWMPVLLIVLIGGSLLLSAAEQQSARVLVANSRAVLAFQAAHPGVPVYGTGHAESMSSVMSALGGAWPSKPQILALSGLTTEAAIPASADAGGEGGRPAAYAILDPETKNWGGTIRVEPENVPGCWRHQGVLEPQGFGAGGRILGGLRSAAAWLLPEKWAQKALHATDAYYRPRPADIYEIPKGCSFRI
jgi:4-amino-4-deoxy-L-arabinose transferase-like glycosyltransferase